MSENPILAKAQALFGEFSRWLHFKEEDDIVPAKPKQLLSEEICQGNICRDWALQVSQVRKSKREQVEQGVRELRRGHFSQELTCQKEGIVCL